MYVSTALTDSVSAADWSALAGRAAKTGDDVGAGLPASWGSDVVTLSPEARAALAGATRGGHGGEEQTDSASGSTREAFARYLEKARNQTQDDEEGDELEKLRKKLKELRKRLAQAMTGKNGDSTNDGLAKALNSQISEVAAQIAELTAQALQARGK